MDTTTAYVRLHWGRAPGSTVTIVSPVDRPLVTLGRLVRVELATGLVLVPEPGSEIWLTTTPAFDELFLVAEHPVAGDADGHIDAIVYDTQKGDTDAHWRHLFSPPLPQLIDGQVSRGDSTYTITDHGIEG